MNDNQALTGRPQAAPTLQAQKLTPVARVQDHVAAPEAVNSDLTGLVQGLQALNPELQKYGNAQRQEERTNRVNQAEAAAYKVEAPRDALTGSEVPIPEDLPPAFNEMYGTAYKRILTQRAASQTATDIISEYASTKDTEGFNATAFLKDQRQKALAGLTDPQQVEVMGKHLDEVSQRVQAADNQRLLIQHQENSKATMGQLALTNLVPGQSPEEMLDKANYLVAQGATIQVHPSATVKTIVQRLTALSRDKQGLPELFDVLDQPNAEGVTLRSLAPDLSNEIDVAKEHARNQRERRIHEETEGNRFGMRVVLDNDLDTAPATITVDRVKAMVGKNMLTAEQGASYVNQARDRVAKMALGNEATQAYDEGILGRYEPEVQKKVLEARLGPVITATWKTLMGGPEVPAAERQAAGQQLAEAVLQAHSKARASIPVEALTRLVGTAVTAMPDANGPSSAFLASAALYKALGGAPQYRDLYFKGDTADIMRSYTTLQDSFGRDTKTAYERAYISNSPEEKERMAKRVNDPAFLTEVEDTARKSVTGASWMRLWGGAAGFNGRPQNDTEVGTWVSAKVKEFWKANPQYSREEVIDRVETMARDNWVMDSVSRRAVRVPSSMGGDRASEAFSDFTQAQLEAYRKKGSITADSTIRYAPIGDTGMYTIQAVDGSMEKSMGQVSIQEVLRRYDVKTNLQPEEAKKLRQVSLDLRAGKPIGEVDPVLLAKGRSSGFLSRTDIGRIDIQQNRTLMDSLKGTTQFDLGKPTNSNTFLASRGSVKVDHKLTASTALGLLEPGNGIPLPDHLNLAASLVAAREGVVLGAYQDPARGAGQNIGTGYNLKANAATVDADLKAVGVPPERLQDIKEGRAGLTPDQAKWLTQLSVKRFEPKVKAVAEATQAGLWDKLTPPQKAVMVDVAYQTGDASQYKKAWASLAKGDTESFRQELKTFYTNQAGQRTEDTRALDLRSSLLQGLPAWKARLTVASR
jgi:GH24 family phage-related lysozyme (muramidase)